MDSNDIRDIVHMRMAVYASGMNAGVWKDLDKDGASDMMNYIFPKSGQLAYYQLILEHMRAEHKMMKGGVYTLFKMPFQVEKEIVDYLKKSEVDFREFLKDPDHYLEMMDTIVTDHQSEIVNIGVFSASEVSNLLRLCASHYRYAFSHNVTSYPYFE